MAVSGGASDLRLAGGGGGNVVRVAVLDLAAVTVVVGRLQVNIIQSKQEQGQPAVTPPYLVLFTKPHSVTPNTTTHEFEVRLQCTTLQSSVPVCVPSTVKILRLQSSRNTDLDHVLTNHKRRTHTTAMPTPPATLEQI